MTVLRHARIERITNAAPSRSRCCANAVDDREAELGAAAAGQPHGFLSLHPKNPGTLDRIGVYAVAGDGLTILGDRTSFEVRPVRESYAAV